MLRRTKLKRRVPGTARLKAGRKTNAWTKVRRELSKEFLAQGIVSCELKYDGCWGEAALSFAHGRKRRHLKEGELKTLTILACTPCHDKLEYLRPEEMLTIVENIICDRVEENQ